MKELIEELIRTGFLKTPAIIDAFSAIDRKDFMLDIYKSRAYENTPVPIDHGQTISQPATVAFMLELLAPKPGDRVLDIGAGSGWQTALLAHIVGPEGHVYALEIVPELAAFGAENVEKYEFIKDGRVTFLKRSAEKGLPEHAPFERIIAAASADRAPDIWKEELAPGGTLVLPVKESIWRIRKNAQGAYDEQEYPGFLFVPFVQTDHPSKRSA